jgi:hypothetical protein
MKTENFWLIFIILGIFILYTETDNVVKIIGRIKRDNAVASVSESHTSEECLISQEIKDAFKDYPVEDSFPVVSNLINVTTLYTTWYSCSTNKCIYPDVKQLFFVSRIEDAIINMRKDHELRTTWHRLACSSYTNRFPNLEEVKEIRLEGTVSDCRDMWSNCEKKEM